MDIDITRQLGAVTREVVGGERDGLPTAIVRVTRTYDTDVADLWEAITDRDRLPRWFLPITGDLRLGGRYQLEGNAGGEIAACEPPHHLAVTWEFGEDTTWVEVHLVEDPAGGARLELEHTVPATGEHWDQFGPGAVGIGWELGLMGLDLHLSSGAPVDPDAVAAWQVTDDAKAYTVTSSDGWCQADVAGGTPEAAARAAADRTTSAYTGDPADPGPG